jgi:hypothetical protein
MMGQFFILNYYYKWQLFFVDVCTITINLLFVLRSTDMICIELYIDHEVLKGKAHHEHPLGAHGHACRCHLRPRFPLYAILNPSSSSHTLILPSPFANQILSFLIARVE